MNDSPPESRPTISRYAIAGAFLLPFGFLLLLAIPSLSDQASSPISNWPINLRYLLLALGCLAVIGTTLLGFLAVSQIRNSDGSLYGNPLAVAEELFYPIILLDLVLFIIGWSLLSRISQSSLVPLAWLVAVVIVDYLLIRYTWRLANR